MKLDCGRFLTALWPWCLSLVNHMEAVPNNHYIRIVICSKWGSCIWPVAHLESHLTIVRKCLKLPQKCVYIVTITPFYVIKKRFNLYAVDACTCMTIIKLNFLPWQSLTVKFQCLYPVSQEALGQAPVDWSGCKGLRNSCPSGVVRNDHIRFVLQCHILGNSRIKRNASVRNLYL